MIVYVFLYFLPSLSPAQSYTIKGRVYCKLGDERNIVFMIDNAIEKVVLNPAGIFELNVPEAGDHFISIQHRFCRFKQLLVRVGSNGVQYSYLDDPTRVLSGNLHLQGEVIVENKWWKSPRMICFYTVHVLMVLVIWGYIKLRIPRPFRKNDLGNGDRRD
ncbi:hypothetical protein GWI33_005333 [Rhynchophorus ferrugineus]|uniref:Uncharacterized protein n=1 Tax=Rhynchophorus ferrugineus TaxID=354439 RepID=A0A834IWQ5_RHYFE|nr:hypothetical protein GWI33_005333 [Rhynchophorus ferrugineus]